jgi:hypothetical protein
MPPTIVWKFSCGHKFHQVGAKRESKKKSAQPCPACEERSRKQEQTAIALYKKHSTFIKERIEGAGDDEKFRKHFEKEYEH